MALLLNAGDTVSRSYSYTQPSPLHPIQPQGTGDKTANLWCAPITETSTQSGITTKTTAQSSEFLISKSITAQDTSKTINCDIKLPAGTYTVAVFGGLINYHSENEDRIALHDGSSYFQNNILVGEHKTFTLSESKTITRVLVVCKSNSEYSDTPVRICIVQGSTPPSSYIPYGYKIPISSADTTTPVYLGEVETTRKIKKYEFTGEENISDIGDYYNTNVSVLSIAWSATISTTGGFQINNGGNRIWANKSNFSSYATATDFKTYLAQQYAAGTPVTVWYVLATPETGIVNEPIRKIGNYADTVSGITIPTIAGANTLSVGTTLQPSEVTVNYKGWHPVQSVHERENGAWT